MRPPPDADPGGDAVRARLRELAVAVQVQTGDRTRADAEAAVDSGAWTADPVAAAFLGDESVDVPLRYRVRRWLAPRDETARRIQRTIDELDDRAPGVALDGD